MNALDAAEQVLAQAGEPLSYRDLTRRAVEMGLWETEGLTPEATIRGRLSMDIVSRGVTSRFQRTAKGVFALRRWGLPEYTGMSSRSGNSTASTVEVQVKPFSALPAVASATAPPTTAATKLEPVVMTSVAEPVPLSFTDAAEQVLVLYGNQQPMHYRDITQRALDLGLIETAGKTPEATLYASVLQEIGRQTRRGETPRFVRLGRGLLGLSRWQRQGLDAQIEQHNTQVRAQLLARLKSMPPDEFESLIGELLAAIGFEEVEVTSSSGDGGIDVRGTLVVGDVIRTRMAVQVKRWRHNVQAPTVQQVRGALGTHEQGLIITTSDFSSGARTEAERPNAVPVALMDGEQLVALLVEHGIGVWRTPHELLALDGSSDSDMDADK